MIPQTCHLLNHLGDLALNYSAGLKTVRTSCPAWEYTLMRGNDKNAFRNCSASRVQGLCCSPAFASLLRTWQRCCCDHGWPRFQFSVALYSSSSCVGLEELNIIMPGFFQGMMAHFSAPPPLFSSHSLSPSASTWRGDRAWGSLISVNDRWEDQTMCCLFHLCLWATWCMAFSTGCQVTLGHVS